MTGAPGGNARAHARSHTLARRRLRARPTASPRRGNLTQPGKPGTPPGVVGMATPPRRVVLSEEKCKKVAKSFGGSKKNRNFAPMEAKKWIITGVNRLTHQREQLSRPMDEQEASERLQREVANRKYQRYQPHTRLKMERLEAVQLTLQFGDHENS